MSDAPATNSESILRSLGYRKQTIKRSQDQPAPAETPVLDVVSNDAPAPDAVDSPQLGAEAPVSEAAPLPEPVAPTESAPEPGATSAPLNPAEVVASTDIEVTVWRMAAKAPSAIAKTAAKQADAENRRSRKERGCRSQRARSAGGA